MGLNLDNVTFSTAKDIKFEPYKAPKNTPAWDVFNISEKKPPRSVNSADAQAGINAANAFRANGASGDINLFKVSDKPYADTDRIYDALEGFATQDWLNGGHKLDEKLTAEQAKTSGISEALFKALDSNNDGLSLDEYKQLVVAWDKASDGRLDGRITEQGMTDVAKSFETKDDPYQNKLKNYFKEGLEKLVEGSGNVDESLLTKPIDSENKASQHINGKQAQELMKLANQFARGNNGWGKEATQELKKFLQDNVKTTRHFELVKEMLEDPDNKEKALPEIMEDMAYVIETENNAQQNPEPTGTSQETNPARRNP